MVELSSQKEQHAPTTTQAIDTRPDFIFPLYKRKIGVEQASSYWHHQMTSYLNFSRKLYIWQFNCTYHFSCPCNKCSVMPSSFRPTWSLSIHSVLPIKPIFRCLFSFFGEVTQLVWTSLQNNNYIYTKCHSYGYIIAYHYLLLFTTSLRSGRVSHYLHRINFNLC